MKKYFYWSGLIAPLLYVMAVVIGGALIPGYSHINQAISEIDPLIDDKYAIIINILFGLYNALTLTYGLFLLILNKDKSKLYKVQAISLAIVSLGGLLMYFFPMDAVGTPVTTAGTIHIVLAGIMAPLTILVSFLGNFTFKDNKKMRLFSLVMSVVIFICGGASAILTANGLPLMGLFERITIGSYIIWIFVSALYYKKLSN